MLPVPALVLLPRVTSTAQGSQCGCASVCQTNPSCHRGPGSLAAARINRGGSDPCQIQSQHREYPGAESGVKPIACFSTLTRPRYSSEYPGDKIQHSQLPSDTNDSCAPPAAAACPIEDGSLESQGCPTDWCMLEHLHSPQLYSTRFPSARMYFKPSSSHLSTQAELRQWCTKQGME